MLEGLTITGITLTPEACSEILETAIEAGYSYGFGYWADLQKVEQAQTLKKPLLSLTLKDRESRKRFAVTHAEVRAAVLKMLQDPKGCGCRGLISQMVGDNGLDGPLAEAIIQVACFGEVVYG